MRSKLKHFRLLSRLPRSWIPIFLLAAALPFLQIALMQRQNTVQYAATTHQVNIVNYSMDPKNLTINAGDTVQWTNQDQDPHDARSNTETFASPLLEKGQSFSFTFTTPGTFEYYCTPHKSIMKGYTITVLPSQSAVTSQPTLVPISPTIAPTATLMPTNAATSAPPPPIQATTAPAPTVGTGTIMLELTLSLHGIGLSGDTANPRDTSMSNSKPATPQKQVTLLFLNSAGQTVYEQPVTVSYAADKGDFRGTISIDGKLATDRYTVKLKMPKYLQKIAVRDVMLSPSGTTALPQTTLVVGDQDGNNALDTLDYNAVLNCFAVATTTCTPAQIQSVDFNDDGKAGIEDLNLLLREFSVQKGD